MINTRVLDLVESLENIKLEENGRKEEMDENKVDPRTSRRAIATGSFN